MDKLKQWVALTVVAVLAIGAASWFLLVSPKRSEAADLHAQKASVDSEVSGLQSQIQLLKVLAKDLPKAQAQLAAVAAKIPDNPALPALIRALTSAADDAGVELVALTPGRPTAVLTAAKTTAAKPVAAAAATAGTPVATTATPGAAAAAPLVPAGGTLQSISLDIDVVGPFFAVEQFFDEVENLTRAFKVTEFSMKPGESPAKAQSTSTTTTVVSNAPPRTLTTTITGDIYLVTGRTTTTPAARAVAAK